MDRLNQEAKMHKEELNLLRRELVRGDLFAMESFNKNVSVSAVTENRSLRSLPWKHHAEPKAISGKFAMEVKCNGHMQNFCKSAEGNHSVTCLPKCPSPGGTDPKGNSAGETGFAYPDAVGSDKIAFSNNTHVVMPQQQMINSPLLPETVIRDEVL
jgi:hypothetical protein